MSGCLSPPDDNDFADAAGRYMRGEHRSANRLLRALLAATPSDFNATHLHAVVMHRLHDHRQAATRLRRALAIVPRDREAIVNLLSLSTSAGDPELLAVCLGNLRHHADDPEIWSRIGHAWLTCGRPDRAAAAFEESVRLRPDDIDGYINLSAALDRCGRIRDAAAKNRRAVALGPSHGDALANLSTIFDRTDERQLLARWVRRALASAPDHALALFCLAKLHCREMRMREACRASRQLLAREPNYLSGWNLLSGTAMELADSAVGYAAICRALASSPMDIDANWNRACFLLATGRYPEGWEAYEWRWKLPAARPRRSGIPPWRGEALGHRSLLLYSEQGLGDFIQFLRFVPPLAARGVRVVVESPPTLARIAATCSGVAQVVLPGDTVENVAAEAPLLSLARILGVSLQNLSSPHAYLRVAPELRVKWRTALPSSGFRVGLVWQGNPRQPSEPARSVPLRDLVSVLRVPGCRFVSLQRDHGRDQLLTLPDDIDMLDLGPTFSDLADTAATLSELDLVITTCTAVAHLAGALGRPVWVMLKTNPDWRWLLGRDDSPWYPTARLFRQREPGRWSDVAVGVSAALRVEVERWIAARL